MYSHKSEIRDYRGWGREAHAVNENCNVLITVTLQRALCLSSKCANCLLTRRHPFQFPALWSNSPAVAACARSPLLPGRREGVWIDLDDPLCLPIITARITCVLYPLGLMESWHFSPPPQSVVFLLRPNRIRWFVFILHYSKRLCDRYSSLPFYPDDCHRGHSR